MDDPAKYYRDSAEALLFLSTMMCSDSCRQHIKTLATKYNEMADSLALPAPEGAPDHLREPLLPDLPPTG